MPEVLQLVGAYEDKTDTVKPPFSVNYDHKKEVTIQMKSAIVRLSATVLLLKGYHKTEIPLSYLKDSECSVLTCFFWSVKYQINFVFPKKFTLKMWKYQTKKP